VEFIPVFVGRRVMTARLLKCTSTASDTALFVPDLTSHIGGDFWYRAVPLDPDEKKLRRAQESAERKLGSLGYSSELVRMSIRRLFFDEKTQLERLRDIFDNFEVFLDPPMKKRGATTSAGRPQTIGALRDILEHLLESRGLIPPELESEFEKRIVGMTRAINGLEKTVRRAREAAAVNSIPTSFEYPWLIESRAELLVFFKKTCNLSDLELAVLLVPEDKSEQLPTYRVRESELRADVIDRARAFVRQTVHRHLKHIA